MTRKLTITLSAFVWVFSVVFGMAEETLADLLAAPQTSLARPADRDRVVRRMGVIERNRRDNARTRAARLGLPLRTIHPNGRIQEIADFDLQGRPLYLVTHNVNAAISTGANLLRSTPYSLSGSGVVVGLWDGGSARSTHQEFGTRVTVMDGALPADHASHVGGTIAATGVVAGARGMANGATLDSYDWNSDSTEMTGRAATGPAQAGKIYLSNHSYGYISGWNYVNGGSPARVWEWNGLGTTNTALEDDFGRYNTYARDSDSLAFNAPYYLIFRSAGNDRSDNPSAGQNVALSPGSATVVAYDPAAHPGGDGSYRGGFDTIGFNALGKNVITIGSTADAVTSGARNPPAANVSSFSSWGPTDDGRIKPDVVANGEALYSSLGSSDTAYGNYNGTSMATPNACGSAALLIQHYGNLFPNQSMRSSTLKGLLIHTADDRGNAGPDYKYGWGLINVKAAADLLNDHLATPAKKSLTENQLTTSTTTRTVSFQWDGVSPLSATLCWTDPAGAYTTTSESRTARLVNNLNLKIIAPGGAEYLPFVMPFVGIWTQASMDQTATTGVNTTDNVEQVRIAAPPAAGTYQAVVSYAGTLTNSSQYYSLLITGGSAESPPLALTAVSPASGVSSGTATITLAGTGLRADTAVKLTRSGQPDLTATGVSLADDALTCELNLTGAAAGTWDVVATNPNAETSTLSAAFTVVGEIWSESFDGTVTGWTSETTKGTNSWSLSTAKSQSPTTSYFAPGPNRTSTTYLNSPSIAIPGGATNLQLRFWHNYTLESNKDGGRLEFSIDNGAWFDVVAANSGAAFASNGYAGTISSTSSDFPNMAVWTGSSGTFVETIVNFTDNAKYAGKNLRCRWGLATNNSVSSTGWYVDSISLLGDGSLTNLPPTITVAATSSSTETTTDPDSTVYQIIRSTTTNLSTSATDDAAESALTYTWNVESGPTEPVSFSVNGTNSAKNTTIGFGAPGDYQLRVTVRDAQGLTAASTVNLRVLQTPSGLTVSPIAVTLPFGTSQTFTATLIDQFNKPMEPQPPSFLWASTGGTINSAGVFSASAVGGPFVITASSSGFSNTASVTVDPAPATVTLSNLSHIYNGDPKSATVTTEPAGLTVSTTYDGSPTAPTNAGSYAVVATVTDPNHQGSATGTLVIGKKDANVTLGGLSHIYDGDPKSASVATDPAGLTVSTTYDGSPTAPTNAGSYAVVATVTDPNHQGSATGTLVIGKKDATVTLGGLSQIYDDDPKSATVTTEPAGLTVSITYDGSPTAPTNAGSYEVVATVTDPNHQGSATGTLVIGKKDATVTLGGLGQIYDGDPKSATVTTEPAGLTVSTTYDGSPTAPTNAGSYAVVATVTDPNHQGSATGTLVIGKKDATVTLGGLGQIYDGDPKSATVTTDPAGLTVSTTYEGSPTAPTNAGSYEVVATVTDPNHQGSATGTLVIGKKDATVTLGGLSRIYDGDPKSATVATEPAGLTVSTTYDGASTPPANAGSYEVVATVTDPNHQGGATGILVIGKKDATVTLGGLSRIYDGDPKSATVATDPADLTFSTTYEGSPTAPTDAGSYEVVATVTDPNHQGSATGTLVIGKKDATVTLGGLSRIYDGDPKSATVTTEPAGLTVSTTYEGSPTAPTNAGSYAVVATVTDPNHQGSATGTLVIGKKDATVTLGGLSRIYDGDPKSATVTTEPAGLTVSTTYDGSPTAPTNAGSYEVVATVTDPNHQGSATGTLVIGKKDATVTLGGLSQIYDDDPKSATVTTEPAGLTVSTTYDGSLTPPTNAGSYAVVATVTDPNHQGSATGTLVIGKKDANVTLGGLSQIYDGDPKSATAATDPAGLTVSTTYDGSPTAPTDAGSYAVVATITDPNHQGSATGTLVIGKKDAAVTLGGLSQIYDGDPKSATVTTEPAGLTVSTTYDGSPTAPTDAGSYAVVATITDPNHQGSVTGTLVIGKKDAAVTLGGLSQIYDGDPKSATVTTEPAGLTVSTTYDGSPTAPTNAGSYAVVATVTDPNHQGGATGTLVIGKKDATVTLGGLSQIYDDDPKSATVTTEPAGLTVSTTYDGSPTAPTNAGSYEVVATVTDPNHQGSATGTLVIEPENSWAAWQAKHFTVEEQAAGLAIDEADPDGDGWANLAEYALGWDPHAISPPLEVVADDASFSITFTRPIGLPDVAYTAEQSDRPANWEPATLEVIAADDTTETVRVSVPNTTGDPDRHFIRLRFTHK